MLKEAAGLPSAQQAKTRASANVRPRKPQSRRREVVSRPLFRNRTITSNGRSHTPTLVSSVGFHGNSFHEAAVGDSVSLTGCKKLTPEGAVKFLHSPMEASGATVRPEIDSTWKRCGTLLAKTFRHVQ